MADCRCGEHSAATSLALLRYCAYPGFRGGADALNVIFSPVAYLREEEVHDVINTVIDNVRRECAFIQSVDRSAILGTVFNMLAAGVTCLKHEGFCEEREWRVIYSPKRNPSRLVESHTEVVSGIPQTVHKLPLDVNVSPALAGLDLVKIFDRLIIGPTAYQWPLYEAFVRELSALGVTDAEKRVFFSGIPIRPW